jgi:hypothetical protein
VSGFAAPPDVAAVEGGMAVGYLYVSVVWLVGVVFVAAVGGKLRDRDTASELTDAIAAMVPLGRRAAGVLTWLLVAGEVTVVALLVVPVTRPWGLAGAAAMLTGFAVAVGLSVRRGVQARCACFGSAGPVLRAHHAWRNAVLAVVVGAAAGIPLAVPGLAGPPLPAVPLLALGGAATALIFIRLDDVLGLFGDASPTR